MDEPQRRRPRRVAAVSSVVGIGVAVAGLAFVVRTLVTNWSETQALLEGASWGWLLLAVPVALLGMLAVGVPWREVIAALGPRPELVSTLRWFFPGQLGKYVPGGIWPVVGRGELATKGGLTRTVAYTSVALSLATTYLAAALTALALLALSVALGGRAEGSLWALVFLPAGLVLLHPAVLTRLVAIAERVSSRDVPVTVPEYRTIVRLVVIHVPAWLLIGSATWLVARALDPHPPVAQVLFAAVLSWLVGFVVIPAPGGIGIREAAFVAAATSLPDDVAAATALVARLCFITADLLGAAFILAIRPSGTRPASPSTAPSADP